MRVTYAVIQLQYHMIHLLDESNLRGHTAPVSHDTLLLQNQTEDQQYGRCQQVPASPDVVLANVSSTVEKINDMNTFTCGMHLESA